MSNTDLIVIKNLIKTYATGDTSFNALDDVSLSVKQGESVAIMGASGSGKSTFMNVLGCLDKPTSGTYFLDGIDVSKMTMDELSAIRNRKLGFVFQGFNLISRTSALENVEMPMIYKGIPPEERIKRAKAALKIVGLEKRETHMPNQMSGGQQQLLALGKLLLVRPELLLLDEPTQGLDAHARFLVARAIEEACAAGSTVIFASHDLDFVQQVAQTVSMMFDGELACTEPTASFFMHNVYYRP